MIERSYKTRTQASEYLHEKDSLKSVAQWLTYLKDIAKANNGRKVNPIPFQRATNGITLYEVKDLDAFIEKRKAKAKKKNNERIEQIKQANGLDDKTNENQHGQNFGYKWQGATVTQIVNNEDTSATAAAIQLIINHPLRVSALSTDEAKELVQELIDVIKRVDPSYTPTLTQRPPMRRIYY